jgi:hypothetical protein
MIRSDQRWLSLVDSFHAAALGEQRWKVALQGLADATGSRSAQLTGIHSETSVLFNTVTNIDPATHSDLLSSGPLDFFRWGPPAERF